MTERIDDTGFGSIKVIQNEGLGYGVDAILLAAFAAGETGARKVESGSSIIDLGCGSGIVGFVMCHKLENVHVLGVDKRDSAVARASRAAKLNKMDSDIEFMTAEVNGLKLGEDYDVVVSNPPYFRQNSAIPSDDSDRFQARHETTATLQDFIEAARNNLKNGGSLYMVHRPDRLVDIIYEMRMHGIEPKTIQFVLPHPSEAPNIVLVHGVKGAGSEVKVLPAISVHENDGKYTEIIQRIYERR